MSEFITEEFTNLSAVADWLKLKQPLKWQVLWQLGHVIPFKVIAEVKS